MLGGFNSVKRENHHYKYAHCETINDLKTVNQNYKNDFPNNEKCFNWNMDSYVHDGSSNLFGAESTIITFDTLLPKTTNAKNLFHNTKTLKISNTNYENFTNVEWMFCGSRCMMSENFHPNTTNFSQTFRESIAGFATGENPEPVIIPYNESIDKATILSGCFMDYSVGQTWNYRQTKLDSKYTFPNVTAAGSLFYNGWPYTETGLAGEYNLDFGNTTTLDHAFSGCMGLTHLIGNFKNLSNGDNMFKHCKIDKSTVFNFRDTVKEWTSGTHKIYFGIYAGYKHDPEIFQAFEDIKAKGWEVAYAFNVSSSIAPPTEFPENETLCEEIKNNLELDIIKLPYGYERCLYLEDNGTQFIDTGILPSNDIGGWNIIRQTELNKDGVSFGVQGNNQHWYVPRWPTCKYNPFYGWKTIIKLSNNVGTGSTALSSLNWLNDKKAIINLGENDIISSDLSNEEITITNPITLFKRNGDASRQWYGRIYRAKISEGDQIIRDFIPALDPDGKPCMYEMIEGKPYYNAATSGDDFLYKVYEDYVMPEFVLPSLNIEEGNVYTPDASSWNEIATAKLAEAEEKIVRVVNGIAYNE